MKWISSWQKIKHVYDWFFMPDCWLTDMVVPTRAHAQLSQVQEEQESNQLVGVSSWLGSGLQIEVTQ